MCQQGEADSNREDSNLNEENDPKLPAGPLFQIFTFVIELLVVIQRVFLSILKAGLEVIIPLQPKDIRGQTVLITGAGNGLGKLLALDLVKLGVHLVLIDYDEDANNDTKSEIKNVKETGQLVYTYHCDLSKRADLHKVIGQIRKDVSKIDILVNCAGTANGKMLTECPEHAIDRVFEVNVKSQILLTKAFLSGMIDRQRGHIVNVASISGFIGLSGLVDYCATKFASVGFSEALQRELRLSKAHGVHVTAVCPALLGAGMFGQCSPRFPKAVELEYAVQQIIQGVLANKDVIFIPWYMRFAPTLKELLPVRAFNAVLDFIGVTSFVKESWRH